MANFVRFLFSANILFLIFGLTLEMGQVRGNGGRVAEKEWVSVTFSGAFFIIFGRWKQISIGLIYLLEIYLLVGRFGRRSLLHE